MRLWLPGLMMSLKIRSFKSRIEPFLLLLYFFFFAWVVGGWSITYCFFSLASFSWTFCCFFYLRHYRYPRARWKIDAHSEIMII